MASNDRRLESILVAIVRAHRAPDGTGHRRALSHRRTGGMREGIRHHAWPDDGPLVRREDLEDFADRSLVRIDYLQRSWGFAPTPDAYEVVEDFERETGRAQRTEAVDTSWAAVRPVLHTVVDVWERNGAPRIAGVTTATIARALDRQPEDLRLVRALELLEENGWIATDYEMGSGEPLSARPMAKALAGTRGWPSEDNEAAGERLLAALDELTRTGDDRKRNAATRARNFLIDLGSGTLSEIAAKTAGGAL